MTVSNPVVTPDKEPDDVMVALELVTLQVPPAAVSERATDTPVQTLVGPAIAPPCGDALTVIT